MKRQALALFFQQPVLQWDLAIFCVQAILVVTDRDWADMRQVSLKVQQSMTNTIVPCDGCKFDIRLVTRFRLVLEELKLTSGFLRECGMSMFCRIFETPVQLQFISFILCCHHACNHMGPEIIRGRIQGCQDPFLLQRLPSFQPFPLLLTLVIPSRSGFLLSGL